ncbi:MAG: ImmA/IrrE family metallo-endopeptidase [Alphaproteobacteria bacterium]|mgnify:CR=1 FL=1|nr:ImmA/IrrE family metallo-endopeptidase [Alphaproteobacteria bacterium]
MFNPSRLVLARKRRGLTQIRLAELASITRLTVHRYESGEVEPPRESVEALARQLSFPAKFFFAPKSIDEPNPISASFRGMAAMTAAERDAALAAGALAFLLDDWVHERFALPAVDIPSMAGEAPEIAARSLRQQWAIGERPIKNIVHLLEAKGVRVFSLVEETRTVDAFSLWRATKPYIFLNTQKTAEHGRFDAAHELGHLVLHKHGGPQGKQAEDEANKFASAFLMPESDVKAIAPTASNIRQIISMKRRWGVSAIAMTYRLHKLKCISDWQYRQFAIQLSDLGYRRGEPDGIQRETSVIWKKVLAALWSERVTKNQIASALHLPVAEIENLVFGLASMTTLDGAGAGSGKGRAELRLVRNNDA